jgi:hypothetical protein
MTLNALIFIGLGIAFALYGPLMVALFGVLRFSGGEGGGLYWYVASFARLFGAALFGFGFLILAARNLGASGPNRISPETRRGIISALLLGNIVGLFVTATQQYTVWTAAGGWAAILVFLLLVIGYGYFLTRPDLTGH